VLKKQRNGRKGGKRVESRVTRDDLSSGNGLAFGFGNCTLVAVVVHRNASPACNEISRPCVKVLSLFFLFFPFFFFFFFTSSTGQWHFVLCVKNEKQSSVFVFIESDRKLRRNFRRLQRQLGTCSLSAAQFTALYARILKYQHFEYFRVTDSCYEYAVNPCILHLHVQVQSLPICTNACVTFQLMHSGKCVLNQHIWMHLLYVETREARRSNHIIHVNG